jgi:hypothetical protein
MIFGLLMFLAVGAPRPVSDNAGTGIDIRLVTDADYPPGLYAFLTTTSTYPCAGYRLRTIMTREYETLSVRISGPVRPTPCLATMDEARGQAYLGNPAYGTYLLRIVYDGREDLYSMTCFDRVPTIVPISRGFTTITY